jgi:hypothetical protein
MRGNASAAAQPSSAIRLIAASRASHCDARKPKEGLSLFRFPRSA